MQEQEVIIVDGIPDAVYRETVEKSLRYALVSLPFTFNRLNLDSLKWRILNIAKGRIAEELFLYFSLQNQLPIDFSLCRTPFYQIDRRDFICHNLEWDIKNNYLVHSGKILVGRYTDLPGLIPDNHAYDQWSKRREIKNQGSEGVGYLFTFLKWCDHRPCDSRSGFFDFYLTRGQKALLLAAWEKYRGKSQSDPPFQEARFWKRWDSLNVSDSFCQLRIQAFPVLVITAYATSNDFARFSTIPANSTFLNGVLHTKIRNRGVLLKALPSFVSLFPALKQNMVLAHFRNETYLRTNG